MHVSSDNIIDFMKSFEDSTEKFERETSQSCRAGGTCLTGEEQKLPAPV